MDSDFEVGTTFNACYTDYRKPSVMQDKIRPLKEGEVLIRVHSAPVHFGDQGFSRGYYGNKKDLPKAPAGLGSEGAGEIVSVGEGVSKSLIGRKAAFTQTYFDPDYQGSFRQYIYIQADSAMIFPENCEMSYDTLSWASNNSLAVCGLIDTWLKKGYKWVIADASTGASGQIFIKVAKKYGIKLINLVRKDVQIVQLSEIGADIVLNYENENFEENLIDVISEHQPCAYFTSLSGSVASQVFGLMPKRSTLYVYGMLLMEPISLNPATILFESKTVTNFWVHEWVKTLTVEEKSYWTNEVYEDFTRGEGVFETPIGKSFKLNDVLDSMRHARFHGSSGKTILRPQE